MKKEKTRKIEGTAENWESGRLGENPDSARKVKISRERIDAALDLKRAVMVARQRGAEGEGAVEPT